MNITPILILLASLACLSLVEATLSRPRKHADGRAKGLNQAPKTRTKPKEQHPLFPDITVLGLDDRGVTQLRNLIKQQNINAISGFLAFNQPRIIELISYINQIQKLIISNNYGLLPDLDSRLLSKIVKATRLPVSPAGFDLTRLSDDDLAHVLAFDQKTYGRIDRDFMARFGGHDFHRHFVCYSKHRKNTILTIKLTDPDRPTFDLLAVSGIATKGKDIDIADRLAILTVQQLRHMAKDLNMKQSFKNKADAIRYLANQQGSRALFSMIHVLDDLFTLRSIPEQPEDIEREWGYLTACAILLVGSQKSAGTHSSARTR